MLLLRDYAELSEATSLADYQAKLVKMAEALDFPLVNAMVVCEDPSRIEPARCFEVGNTPLAYQHLSHDRDRGSRDPVTKMLKSSTVPFVYDQQTYVDAEAGDLWETQAPFGYRTGILVALRLPLGRHFLLGVDRPDALPGDERKLVRMMGDLQLIAVHAQSAALRLLLPSDVPELSPREVEVLRWLAEGKGRVVVGQILGISENTVKFHLASIYRKLGVASKEAALLKAQEAGLI
jgi:DNA-binding CsgD family transcriptional regulator